jgi:transposase
VSTADDLPVGAALGPANRQDASFTAQALAGAVIPPPGPTPAARVGPAGPAVDAPAGRRGNGNLSTGQLGRLRRRLLGPPDGPGAGGPDVRSMPYLRADGNFAKVTARLAAKGQGWRLWAPNPGRPRRGLGSIRSSVERAHALLNQFGRVSRRLDRDPARYLAWVQLACSVIFMRRGFFP